MLIDVLWFESTVLTALLRLVVDEIAPLRLLLIWDSEVPCPLSTELTAVDRLVTADTLLLRDELI